jgi:hypothetical protein
MKKPLTLALACALSAVAFAAPAAEAGTVCSTAGNAFQKYAGEYFETVNIHMGEAEVLLNEACRTTP